MATIDLAAQPRTIIGKKVKQLRREGVVPANIYGRHADSVAIQVPAVELRHVLRAAGHTGLVRIALDGDRAPVTTLVRQIRRESMTGNLIHVDFQRVSMTEKMTVTVPVLLVGRAPITDEGAIVVQSRDAVDVECLPGDIPQHFEVDISGVASTDAVLHVRDIAVPENVTMLTDGDIVLVGVSMSAAEEAEEAVEEAGEEPVEAEAEAQTEEAAAPEAE